MELKAFGKEHYELMDQFERDYKHCGTSRESKEFWKIGAFYQNGQVNELFKAYSKGYAFHKSTSRYDAA